MTWIKRGLYFAAFCIVFNAAEHWCHEQTDGFTLSRIQFNHEPVHPFPAIDTTPLQQPFHYLDCGNQCFAFLSADGKYVLKFFKYAHHTVPPWLTKIPLIHHLKPLRPHKLKKIAWKRARDFHGYTLADTHFREETGLLAVHLHPSIDALPTITLTDKLHIVHTLDLNTTPFILQRKATPVYTQFSTWLSRGEIEKVKQGIASLLQLCAHRLAKNIQDDDANFYSNFGFVGETPIQIDPGHFTLGSSHPREIEILSFELKEWFLKHDPTLVPYVEAIARSY